jgi:hypothetical protein
MKTLNYKSIKKINKKTDYNQRNDYATLGWIEFLSVD